MLLGPSKSGHSLWVKKGITFFTVKKCSLILRGNFLSFDFEFGIFRSKAKMIFGQFRAILLLGPSKSGRSLWVKKWITFFTVKKVFFDFKGSFLSFVFEFGIFWSKAKLIFGQFRAILLLGPSKSGCSLWVKKWISTELLKNGFFLL